MAHELKRVALGLAILNNFQRYMVLRKLPKDKKELIQSELKALKGFEKADLRRFISELSDKKRVQKNQTVDDFVFDTSLSEELKQHLHGIITSDIAPQNIRASIMGVFGTES